MPLRGDLKEFGVPEIFQLLEQQGKSGCLHIKTSIRDIEVYFREGMVVGAFPDGEKPWDHLLGILCRVGYLSEEDVRRLDKRQASDLTSLKEILRGEALLGPRQIDVLLREHIEELLFPVFRKRRGEFFFVQDKTLPSDWELGEPLAAEPLVLEGLRKSDEWPLLKKRLGSFQEVPQRQVAFLGKRRLPWRQRLKTLWSRGRGAEEEDVPDGSEEDFLVDGEPSLSSAEKTVYSLIDGKRNIEEIIHVSLLGEFSACQAFLSLMDRGWIRFAGPAVPSSGERLTPLAGKERERANLIRGALALAGALVLLLTIQLVTLGPEHKRLSVIPIVREEAPVCRLLNHAQRDRVLHALEVYRKEKGRYPQRLAHLVQERLLRPGDLSLWGSNQFSYLVEPDGEFKLLIAPLPD
jgi:hypothetical protein